MKVFGGLILSKSPSGDTQITELKFFIYEVEIIVGIFALVKLKECFS